MGPFFLSKRTTPTFTCGSGTPYSTLKNYPQGMLAFSLFGKTKVKLMCEKEVLMVMDLTVLKSYLFKKRYLLVIVSCFMLVLLRPLTIEGVLQRNDSVQSYNTKDSLLLNTGMLQAQEAEVSIILWIEDDTKLDEIIITEAWKKLSIPDWSWSYQEQKTKYGNNAITLTGHRIIDKEEERMLYTWYTTIAPVLAKEGVQIYLDERVPEAIDISAYLSQSNTLPSQWFLLDNLVSIAGYQNNLGTSVMAGHDPINIQLLSRGHNTKGHTVLAIPVLLKEF